MFGNVREAEDIVPKLSKLAATTDQPIFMFAAPDLSKYCYIYFVIPEKLYNKLMNNFIRFKYSVWPRAWYAGEDKFCIKQEVEIFAKQIENPFQLVGITTGPGPLHASYATY